MVEKEIDCIFYGTYGFADSLKLVKKKKGSVFDLFKNPEVVLSPRHLAGKLRDKSGLHGRSATKRHWVRLIEHRVSGT